MSAQSEARLIQAVHAYIDLCATLAEGDCAWPEELEALTAWKPGTPPVDLMLIDQDRWRDLTLTADFAYLTATAPAGSTQAAAVHRAVRAVLLDLGYTIEEDA